MTYYEFQRKDSELVHSELVRLCGEQRNRIAELEAADAEDNLCLRTAIERNAELEAEVARLRTFVEAYDVWAVSEEHCGGPLFDAMLEARDESGQDASIYD